MSVFGALSLSLAPPAAACSCAQNSVAKSLDLGATIAIVTRTDTDAKAAIGEFVLVDAVGPSATEVPPRISAELDNGASCRPYVSPGAVAALSPRKEDDVSWTLDGCGPGFDLGDALQATGGDPPAIGAGSAVAYVAGAFGSSRLAAVDDRGRVLAWDHTAGTGEQVAVCPGGSRVVVSGRAAGEPYAKRTPELTVHDATTLASQRTVQVPTGQFGRVVGLRCADTDAERVELLVVHNNRGPGRLLTVEGNQVSRIEIPGLRSGAATPTGFVAVTGDGQVGPGAQLIEIRNGQTRTIADLGELGVDNDPAVSPDGRTVAVFGYPKGDKPNPLRTYDTETGRELGNWSTAETYVTGMAWTSDGRLLVRHEDGYRQNPVPLRSFDRFLRGGELGPGVPGEWAGGLFTVGTDAVSAGGGSQLTVTTTSGDRLVAEELRLAAATDVVAAGPARFATDPGQATAAPTSPEAPGELVGAPFDTEANGSAVAPWVLGALVGGAVLATSVALRRRRT